MRLVLSERATQELELLYAADHRAVGKLIRLFADLVRDPFTGIGKPEPLKHEFKGFWSRRITHEHRLVYSVTKDEVLIVSCYSHYGDK
jgi:toxin YoeB